jgi:hypothetical protein
VLGAAAMKSRGLLADAKCMATSTLDAPPSGETMLTAPTLGETEGAEPEVRAVSGRRVMSDAGEFVSAAPEPAPEPTALPAAGPVAQEATPAPAAAPPVEPAAVASEPLPEAAPPGRLVELMGVPVRALVVLLVVLDWPFSFLGVGIKNLIGGVAVITAIMAAATWIAGPRLAAAFVHRAEAAPVVVEQAKPAAAHE